MAIRTVLDVESSKRAKRSTASYVASVLTLSGPIRWLVAVHSVEAGSPWRSTCDGCQTPVWRSVTGIPGHCDACDHRIGAAPWVVEAGLLLALVAVAIAPLSIPV